MNYAPAVCTLAALLLVGCGDSDSTYTIEEVREDRAPEIPRGAGRSDLQRLNLAKQKGANPHGANPHGADPHGGSMGEAAKPSAPAFAWDLPQGWKELPRRQFRDANFTLERDSSVECFLTIMPGGGGGLAGNVNRWRGQMSLPPIEPAELNRLPKIKMFGRDAVVVELTGKFIGRGADAKDDYGFLAAYLELPGTTLTLKMTGPGKTVTQEKANFIKLAGSLRLDSSHGGHGAHGAQPVQKPAAGSDGIAAGMATGNSGFKWETPEGWTAGRDRSMRVVTLHPGGNKEAQCYVAMMGGDGGGLHGNINRWLDQVGSAQKTPAEINALETVDMLGAKGVLVESYGKFSGIGAEEKDNAGLLGIVCLLDGRAVFVKFIGPADLVKREKGHFIAFSRSLQMDK